MLLSNVTGAFEIIERNSLVAKGKIYEVQNMTFTEPEPSINETTSTFVSGNEIYNEMRVHGYEYGPAFRKLIEIDLNGKL